MPSASLLDAKQRAQLAKWLALANPSNSYKAWRDTAAELPASVQLIFPPWGCLVSSLEFIHQELAAYTGNAMINVNKVKLLGSLYQQMRTYQRADYGVPADPEITRYIGGIAAWLHVLCPMAALYLVQLPPSPESRVASMMVPPIKLPMTPNPVRRGRTRAE